jgi:hypothetical protein
LAWRFLRDGDLVGHDGLDWKNRFDFTPERTYSEQNGGASRLLTASREAAKDKRGIEWRLDIISAVRAKDGR